MSDWTYIQGSVSLETSPFKHKKNKDGTYKVDKKSHDWRFYEGRYLPFGKEQMRVGFPELGYCRNSDGTIKETRFNYKIDLTSYPIIKSSVDKYIKNMPQGEQGLFYSLVKDQGHRSSTSDCTSQHVEDLFYEHLKDVYRERTWESITKKELYKYFPSEIDWVEENTESILTIHDSVRYCIGSEMYNKLINFLSNLIKDGISLDDGIFAFNDYGNYYTLRIHNNKITAEIDEWKQERKTEYWQVFMKGHWIYDSEFELRKVDSFKEYDEVNDYSAQEEEIREYKAKYEPEEDEE